MNFYLKKLSLGNNLECEQLCQLCFRTTLHFWFCLQLENRKPAFLFLKISETGRTATSSRSSHQCSNLDCTACTVLFLIQKKHLTDVLPSWLFKLPIQPLKVVQVKALDFSKETGREAIGSLAMVTARNASSINSGLITFLWMGVLQRNIQISQQ